MWEAHRGSVLKLQLGGHSSDILSCSDDHSVLLWTREGVLKGVLTYGQEIDKLIRPKWNSLIDLDERDAARHKIAANFVKKLQLKPTDPKVLNASHRPKSSQQVVINSETMKEKLAVLEGMMEIDKGNSSRTNLLFILLYTIN